MTDQLPTADGRAVDTAHWETLAESCRVSLRTYEGYRIWLKEHGNELIEVYRWSSDHDPELLTALRRRRETRAALTAIAAASWTNADTHPNAVASALMVEVMSCDEQPGVDIAIPHAIKSIVGGAGGPGVCAAGYLSLVEALRPAFVDLLHDETRRPGWVYLLTDAAEAHFHAWDPVTAARLHDEAWQWVHHLPFGTIQTAKAVGHMAGLHASAISHAPKPHDEQWTRSFDEVIDRLQWARELLLAHCPCEEVATALIGVGISEALLWYFRRRSHSIPWLESEGRRLEVLMRTELDLYYAMDLPYSADSSAPHDTHFPQELHSSITRLLVDLASAAGIVGERDRAEAALKRALHLSQEPHHRLQARLAIFKLTSYSEDRERVLGEILRDVRQGVLERMSTSQRTNLKPRLARAAEELSRDLKQNSRQTAAWFWSRQAASWAQDHDRIAIVERTKASRRSAVEPHDPGEPREALETVADPAEGLLLAEHLTSKVSSQNVLAVVMTLRKIAHDQLGPTPDLVGSMEVVDAWHPEHRLARPGRLLPPDCRSTQDIARAALELADEFAGGYAEYLRPSILVELARHPHFAPMVRRDIAQEAFEAAVKSARWRYALRAQELVLEVSEAVGDTERVRAAAEAIVNVIQRTLAQAAGAADLVDLARHLTQVSFRVASSLAEHGFHALAFDVAHTASGLLSRSFVETPRLVEEFELVERHADRDPEAKTRLFELICDRIAQPPLEAVAASVRPVATTQTDGPSAATIQLIATPEGASWALGCTVGGDETRHWATRLGLTTQILEELREAVWGDLHPIREKRPARALRWLHNWIVRPLLREIAGAEDLFIVPHGAFAGLPIHAALSESGHLIERHRVSYLPDVTDPKPAAAAARTALIGGWDPEIDAPREALDLAAHLKTLGFDVTRRDTARRGRQHFLDPQGDWGMIHVAAHGDFYPWPVSMTSQIRLSKQINIKAGDWLREGCHATFGFINACTVGRHAPHAGDLNGFPLALRVRGAAATISALSLLPSAPARAFALAFYSRWPGSDSLSAYQATCIEAIRRGDPACYWAPYLHTGIPLCLADPKAPQRSRATTGRNTPRRKPNVARRRK